MQTGWVKYYEFPAPYEVDREIYTIISSIILVVKRFPATLEVDRYLYALKEVGGLDAVKKLPAPREVDRELYLLQRFRNYFLPRNRFRPFSREIGSYTMLIKKNVKVRSCSRPLSR